ncbi:MAG: GtrA family protein [Anaerolineae bacterium]
MAYPLHIKIRTQEVERFGRFAIVGLLGTLVDFCVLVVLKEALGLPLLLANTLSYAAGISNNFLLNRTWTYGDVQRKTWWTQFGQFFLVSTIGLLLNNTMVALLSEPVGALIGQPQIGYLAAKVVATLLVLFWNFFANRYWTFNNAH